MEIIRCSNSLTSLLIYHEGGTDGGWDSGRSQSESMRWVAPIAVGFSPSTPVCYADIYFGRWKGTLTLSLHTAQTKHRRSVMRLAGLSKTFSLLSLSLGVLLRPRDRPLLWMSGASHGFVLWQVLPESCWVPYTHLIFILTYFTCVHIQLSFILTR